MEKGWINIYNTEDQYRGDIAKELLEEQGIESVIINHKDSSYLNFGEFEVYVREEHEELARKILEQLIKG